MRCAPIFTRCLSCSESNESVKLHSETCFLFLSLSLTLFLVALPHTRTPHCPHHVLTSFSPSQFSSTGEDLTSAGIAVAAVAILPARVDPKLPPPDKTTLTLALLTLGCANINMRSACNTPQNSRSASFVQAHPRDRETVSCHGAGIAGATRIDTPPRECPHIASDHTSHHARTTATLAAALWKWTRMPFLPCKSPWTS